MTPLSQLKDKLGKMKVASAFGMPHEPAVELIEKLETAIEALEFYSEGRHIKHPDSKNNLLQPRIQDEGETASYALIKINGLL